MPKNSGWGYDIKFNIFFCFYWHQLQITADGIMIKDYMSEILYNMWRQLKKTADGVLV